MATYCRKTCKLCSDKKPDVTKTTTKKQLSKTVSILNTKFYKTTPKPFQTAEAQKTVFRLNTKSTTISPVETVPITQLSG